MRFSPGRAATALGAVALILGTRSITVAAPQSRELSLAEAVRTALEHDAELYIAREDAEIAGENIELARSEFTPRLIGELFGRRDDQPPSSTTLGAVESTDGGTVGITGRISTGMTYTLSAGLLHQRRRDPFFTIYEPAYTTTVRGEIVQPLLRGAFSAARLPILVASLRRDATKLELRARLERTVGVVQIAYWDLVRARSEVDARASNLALATEQVEESKRLKRLGAGSDLDIVEAETGVSRREQELLRTRQDVIDAEARLFDALGVRASDRAWTGEITIVPTDVADIEQAAPDLEAQLALARTRRAEILAARGVTAAESAALELTGDRKRAALDLVATAGTVGFAGELAMTRATTGINTGGMYTTDSAYDGGLGTSLSNTLGRDLHLYLGLRFELLLGDNAAEVRHGIQRRAVSRARLAEREILARIETDVRTTVSRVGISRQVVEAAERTVANTEKLLDGMRKRFRAGASTSFDVLRVSEELTRARVEAARARADYRATLTRLAAATGTLLDGLGIRIDDLGATPK